MADVGSTANKLSTLDGLFKRIYADKLEGVIPSWAIIQGLIKFSESERTGEDFMQPVAVKMEHGVTYAASGAGAFTLNSPIAGQIKKAIVTGYQHVLRSAIDYETMYSGGGGERAFKNATATLVESMWGSIRKRVEIDMLYGQKELGIAESIADTNTSVILTAASWAPGIWAGMEGAYVQVVAANDSAPVTDYTAGRQISKVDLDARKLYISATVPDAVADPTAHIVAGDKVFLYGTVTASTGLTFANMKGIDAILTYASTDLFGISTVDYNLWKGVSHSAGSTDLSLGTILDACAKIVAKGADSDITVICSPVTYANLENDVAVYRRFDSSYSTSKAAMGSKSLEFYGQLGKISVKAHPMVKQGEAFGFSPSLWKRIGATDVTFSRPPMSGNGQQGNFFRELYDAAGVELRCYDHQALFTHAPGKAFKITTIVNS